MRTRAAICWEPGARKGWSVEDIELGDPRPDEVRVALAASGLCHSDDHIDAGVYIDLDPLVGGHEGAGIIEEVGSAVRGLTPGDHVVLAFIPSCGRCYSCVSGRSHLCDLGAHMFDGYALSDSTYRVHARGRGWERCACSAPSLPMSWSIRTMSSRFAMMSRSTARRSWDAG